MDVRPEQVKRHLGKGALAPIWLISGEEPLLLEEAADAVRAAARDQGFSERSVHHLPAKGGNWDEVLAGADALSLFAERKVLEIRMPSGPGTDGGKALAAWAARPAEDTLLLLLSNRAPGRDLAKTRWYKAVADVGVVVPVWPIGLDRLPDWLRERCQSKGVALEAGAMDVLLERVEGNLLAASQEVERLALLADGATWTAETLRQATEDSSRHSVFTLVEEALAGHSRRVSRVLYGLRMEGEHALAVVGILAAEVRKLLAMASQVRSGAQIGAVLRQHRVFRNREQVTGRALGRLKPALLAGLLDDLAAVDLAVKGGLALDPWDELGRICLRLAGSATLPSPRLHRRALQVAAQPDHRLP